MAVIGCGDLLMVQMVHDTLEGLRRELVAAFGDRFECLVLVGSHARGDAQAHSDIDLWLFLDHVGLGDLDKVGDVVSRLEARPEVNVQCTSFAEVVAGAFREGFSPLQLHLDGRVLHGALRLPMPTREQVRREAAAMGCFVMMSCRHYLVGRESAEALRKGKLRNWVLKPLMWALRYEVFACTGSYPKGLDELEQQAMSETARELVRVFRQLQAGEFGGDSLEIVRKTEGVARELAQINT